MLSLIRRSPVPAPVQARHGVPQRPFGSTADQRFFYPSPSHVTVRNEVRRALQQREGLVVVTGAPGTGKTLLCRTLLQELEPGACASIVLDPRITIEDLLLHVLTDFGVISSPRQVAVAGAPTRHQLMRALQHFLASLVPAWGCAVVVIDEAQDLDPEVLEQLRLLLNFETDEAKLLQIVLVGHPELNEMLRFQQLRQLDERVARRCELQPLSESEVAPYIDHRLSMGQRLTRVSDVTVLDADDADWGPPVSRLAFTKSAVRMIARQSHGVPRAINVLCDRALEIAEDRRAVRVDVRIAWAACRRIHSRPVPAGLRTAGRVAIAAAAVLLLAVAGFNIRSWGSSRLPVAVAPASFAGVDSQLVLSKSVGVKSLPGADSFNIRVASFRVAGSAASLAAELQGAGLPAFVRVERGRIHQVIVGPYLSQSEAIGVQSRLESYGHSRGDVFVESFETPDAYAGIGNQGSLIASQGVRR
jgi:type II secretory pathway predicted ATPase ExeA